MKPSLAAVPTLDILVTHLEMTARPGHLPPPQRPSEALLWRAVNPELSFYRYLFSAVGEPWLWWTRTLMSDARLREVIHDPRVEIHVLYAEGQPAGFVELDRRTRDEVEIAFCGLVPRFIGRRLGAFLLQSAIGWAWAPPNVRRVWLHTCTLDHPKAVAFYERHGFRRCKETAETIADPRADGRMPRHAGWLSPALAGSASH